MLTRIERNVEPDEFSPAFGPAPVPVRMASGLGHINLQSIAHCGGRANLPENIAELLVGIGVCALDLD
jgi:hypothetical protein